MEHLRAIAYLPLLIVWGIWHRAFSDDYSAEAEFIARHPETVVSYWTDGTDN